MTPKLSNSKSISEESVTKATGFGLDHWFKTLDAWRASEKTHKEIAAWLHNAQSVAAWWSQMITVEYERARGMRQLHERCSGFAISVSRTISTSLIRAWEAWADPKVLSQWFTTGAVQEFVVGGAYSNNDGDHGTFKCITILKHIRFSWESKHHAPGSDVVLEFRDRGDGKVRIELTHEKLRSKKDAEDLKEGWSWAMDCLKLFLETGEKITFEEWEKKNLSKAVI